MHASKVPPKGSRDELLEKARLEREARLSERKRNASAITLQARLHDMTKAYIKYS